MQKIQILTTQNVTVEYEIAGVGRRIAAALIDLLIVVGYIIAVTMGLTQINNMPYSTFFFIIVFLPVVFYDLLCESFMDGQSFGKKAMNIKVVKMDGSQPGFVNYLLRWVLRIVDVLICYGVVAMVTILINGKGQRLGDLAANTTVIRIRNKDVSLDDTILTELKEDYQVVFPQAVSLTDKDAGIIKEVLDHVNNFDDEETNEKLLSRTKDAIVQRLNITTDMTPFTFLNTILRDYNFTNNH